MLLPKRAAGRWLGAAVAASALFAVSAAPGGAQSANPTPTPPAPRVPPPTATPDRDWDLPAGHFFTQAGAGQGGYSIGNEEGVAFWSAFQRLGGVNALGFPASRRYTTGGFVYQATQAAVLQWRPDLGTAVLGNTFEQLQEAGKDDWLLTSKLIPRPIADDGSTSYEDAVRIRLSWLTDPAIAARYFANPNPAAFRTWTQNDSIQLYGLPMSKPERMGPFVAQRFQRIAFQLWVDAVPAMPAPGSVTPVLGGDLLKEAGLIYGAAATPHSASALVARAVALGATPFPAAAPQATAAVPTATATPRPANTPASARTPTARPTNAQIIDGTLSEYTIFLPQTTAKLGTVRFSVSNLGTLRHNLRVVGSGVDKKTADVRPGQSGSVDVTFAEPGPYTVYCDLADHAAQGMTLSFTVLE